MKSNLVVSVLSGLCGSVLLVSLLSATGVVVARDETQSHAARAASSLGSTFTYHGQLKNGGSPVNGPALWHFDYMTTHRR